MITERLLHILEDCGEMTEEEIRQEVGLCEEDIIRATEDILRAMKILRAIHDGDSDTLLKMRYGK